MSDVSCGSRNTFDNEDRDDEDENEDKDEDKVEDEDEEEKDDEDEAKNEDDDDEEEDGEDQDEEDEGEDEDEGDDEDEDKNEEDDVEDEDGEDQDEDDEDENEDNDEDEVENDDEEEKDDDEDEHDEDQNEDDDEDEDEDEADNEDEDEDEGDDKAPAEIKMAEHRWKEKAQLEWEKKCSASSQPATTCWLCYRIQEWNSFLRTLFICLTEPLPGKLCLATVVRVPAGNLQSPSPETASMIVWLLRKHGCIESLKLGKSDTLINVAVPASVVEMECNVRHISIEFLAAANWDSLLDAIGPITNLESLTLADSTSVITSSAEKLAKLLEASTCSIRKVHVGAICIDKSASDVLISGIVRCQDLRDLKYLPALGAGATFLRSTWRLEKFWLYCDDEKIEEAFCGFIRTNKKLTELHFCSTDEMSVNGVLRAVETNNTLKCLDIYGGLTEVNGERLRSVLLVNRSLCSLIIRGCYTIEFGKLIAEGLSKNEKLEWLDVSGCTVDFQTVWFLCDALRKNNKCSLKFGFIQASLSQREELASTLNKYNLYGRVQLDWTGYDVAGLAASLRSRPIDLEIHTQHLSGASFKSLCQALSCSPSVPTLTVHLSKATFEHVKSLSDAFEENTSLKRVKLIEVDPESRGLAVRASQGLRFNTSATYLEIECIYLETEDAKILRDLIVRSKSLNDMHLSLKYAQLDAECEKIIAQGIAQNPFITSFRIKDEVGADSTVFNDALTLNNTLLNLAVCFVLKPHPLNTCAEAFELFEAQPSLIQRVKEASGMSYKEAKAAVMSAYEENRCDVKHAEHFIPCATGVVYQVPLSCGNHVYIGQTRRCVNFRLREHYDRSGWALYHGKCEGLPEFEKTTVLARHRVELARKMIEADHIRKMGEQCISQPSISLLKKSARRRSSL